MSDPRDKVFWLVQVKVNGKWFNAASEGPANHRYTETEARGVAAALAKHHDDNVRALPQGAIYYGPAVEGINKREAARGTSEEAPNDGSV